MIVYLRVVPGFWIAVEEQTRPELRSQPVIMGGLPHQKGVVREASFLAQQSGVREGMALSQAQQQCPDGIFLTPNLPRYEAIWEELCFILQSYTPLVEPLEMGQAVCDLSGCERHWGDGWSAARLIAAHLQRTLGIAPWIGVAGNRLVAQLASMTVGAGGITVVEQGQERAFIAELPITLLPGVDSRLALTFQVLGLRSIGELAALPPLAVRQRFGVAGEKLHRFARGIDPRSVTPPRPEPSVRARSECESGSLEEASEAICRLSNDCARELEQRGLAGKLIGLKLIAAPAFHSYVPCIARPVLPEKSQADEREPHQPLIPTERNAGRESFLIPYRIHSMLPQPGTAVEFARPEPPASRAAPSVSTLQYEELDPGNPEPWSCQSREVIRKASVAVRTPVSAAPPLREQGQRLLHQMWKELIDASGEETRPPELQAIELEVSEFEAPTQLSFAELNRLDQSGVLGGVGSTRLQALTFQEQVLAARYGDAPFRHVEHVDPHNVLAERRFRWQSGLPGFAGSSAS